MPKRHAAAEDDPPFQRRTWAKANPSLDFMPDLEAAIRTEAGHAKSDPSVLHEFRALRLNGGTSEIPEAVLIEAGTWSKIEGDADRAGPLVWGCDLGTSAAMSAIAAYWPDTGRLETVAAFPVEPPLAERGLRDGVGGLYVETLARGELIQTGQRAVDLDGLLIEALARFGRPNVIAADRWREAEIARRARQGRRATGGTRNPGHGLAGRCRGRSRLSPRGPGRQGDAEAYQAAALCHGRGARAHGPCRQREIGQEVRGRAALDGARRCGGGCDPGRCGGRSTRHRTATPPSTSCACRMSKSPYGLQSTALEGRPPRGIRAGWLALPHVRTAWRFRVRPRHAAATRARARPMGHERAPDPLPGLPYREDAPRELPRTRAERPGVAGAARRAAGLDTKPVSL